MNYFAHARPYLDDPYFVAGTAIPDWLNVVDRSLRVRSRHALPLADDPNQQVASLAGGILQHFRDDDWFHQTRAFTELSLEFTAAARDLLANDPGMRAYFLGHILVEILLDAHLAAQRPEMLHDYYRVLTRLEPEVVAGTIHRMSGRAADQLAAFIPHFVAERFLWDYADDEKLLRRLNQVMARVRLPQLPPDLKKMFPAARQRVAQRCDELLDPPNSNGG